jgi:hypothetical protein
MPQGIDPHHKNRRNTLGKFEIFDEDNRGRPEDLVGMLNWMNEQVESGEMDVVTAINALMDIARPGSSDNSHDVKPIWVGAMHAYGFGAVTAHVGGMWLNMTPFGFGFAVAVEQDFQFEALSEDAQRAVVKAMCCVLQAGSLDATVNDNGTISIKDDDGTISEVDIAQFRREIDETLGPDATPQRDDPMKRWGL